MRKKPLTDKIVAALKPRSTRYTVPDPGQLGLYVRIQPTGGKSFVAVTSDPQSGRQIWATMGRADVLGIEDARARARDAIRRIKQGLPPIAEPSPRAATFADVAALWLKRHVKAKGLRSEYDIRWMLDRYVLPRWKDRAFVSIRRSDIADLLDEIEDRSGARQADLVLGLIHSLADWYAGRHDDYVPPFVKSMRRQSSAARARKRILADDELRIVWQAADASGKFGALVKLLLLTAQRLAKVQAMRWDDISADGVWTIRTAAREKGNAGELRLPPAALAVIDAQPRLASNDYIFSGRSDRHMRDVGHAKRRFDAKLPPMERWTLHDLRRTSRSLMSRAGVERTSAERVLGHTIGGAVERVYDQHRYPDEKAAALARLATLIDSIVDPRDNVIAISAAKSS